MEKISAMRRMNSTFKIEGESYRYLSRWYCPAVREMSRQPNFRCEPQWIADRLVPKITLEQAQEALQILHDLEMLSFTSPTEYTTSEGSFSTTMQVQGLAVHNYYEQMPSLAKGSVKQFPEQQRHLLGVTVSINKDLVPTLKKELNAMVARVLDVCESDTKTKNHIIQVGIHFSPSRTKRRDIVSVCTTITVQKKKYSFRIGKDKREVFRWFKINLRTYVQLILPCKCLKYTCKNKQDSPFSSIVFLYPFVI